MHEPYDTYPILKKILFSYEKKKKKRGETWEEKSIVDNIGGQSISSITYL